MEPQQFNITYLEGRVVLITGAARGLGRAMVLGLLGVGARVAAVDLPETASDLTSMRDKVQAAGLDGRLLLQHGDVTDEKQCRGVVDAAMAWAGTLHALINNAGILGLPAIASGYGDPTKFFEIETDRWRRTIDVNINGMFLMSKAAMPALLASGSGRIVNLVTSRPTLGRAGFSPYAPTKAAIECATVIWSREMAGTGVTVNAIMPGAAAATRMAIDSVFPDRSALLSPDVMVPSAIWICSEASALMTGLRFTGKDWDRTLPPHLAAGKASAPAGYDSVA